MIEIRFVLHDETERNAFNQFWSGVERYRAAGIPTTASVPDATGSTEDPAAAAGFTSEPSVPGPTSVPADSGVVATITPEGVTRAPAEPTVTTAQVEQRFREYAATYQLEAARSVLKQFDVKYLKDLKPEQYAEFLKVLDLVPA